MGVLGSLLASVEVAVDFLLFLSALAPQTDLWWKVYYTENVTVDVVSAGFTNKYHPHSHRVLGEICSGERGFDWERFMKIFLRRYLMR